MWSSRLFWKLFLVYAGLNLALAVGFLVVVSHWHRAQFLEHVERRLDTSAMLLRSQLEGHFHTGFDPQLQATVQRLGRNAGVRITLVDGTGVVLADSEQHPSRMENHRDRQEVLQARREGRGTALRRSPTLSQPMLYLALPVRDEEERLIGFVRTAISLSTIDEQVASIQSLLWMFAIGMGLLALGLTSAVVGRLIRPLEELTSSAQAIADGDLNRRVTVKGSDELGTLGAAFNRMQHELVTRVTELRDYGEQLSTVLGSMVEGVIAVDSDQQILLANNASRQLLDLTSSSIIDRQLLEVTRCRPLNEAVVEALRRERPSESEFELAGSDRRILALRATPLPGKANAGVVVVLHDVTELRRLENLRREFVANVSHELKTPLSSIKAYAETLRLGAVNDAEHNLDFVIRIEDQAERLHQLILDLLHLARVESGTEMFDIIDVPVLDVVELCVAHRIDTAEAKEIDLNIVAPEVPAAVKADEEGLRTIMDNLIDNAIKYTPNGGAVTVRWAQVGNDVVITVDDTGIGIAADQQARVFERFYRADKARSRELGGTGLGLSIVKHLAQSFGGSVGLKSHPGEGSSFQVRLPAAP